MGSHENLKPTRLNHLFNSIYGLGFLKGLFQMNMEYISFIVCIKFLAFNLEHSEKLFDIRKLLL
ncbi:hypothetical protein EXW44_25970 [Bacillus mycoides]|nr:hypothetical protein EXW44_25970 [Bacillus mycoides]